jgi:hypothetical protein
MVLRTLGADPDAVRRRRSSALGVAEQAVSAGRPLLAPVVVTESFEVEQFRHERLSLGQGHLSGPLVAEHLHAARYVVLAVCSIGPALEEAASKCFAEDPALALGLDAFGSAAVDLLGQAMCQIVDERAEAAGESTTVPLSPGLVGWPVAHGQRQIFALLHGALAGVRLTDGYMMVPKKSTSMAIGVGPEVTHAGEFTIEFFEDDDGRSPVEEWMDSDLTDLELAALVFGLEHVLSRHGVDVYQTEWGKQLGEGLFEFRIRHTSAEIEHMFTGASSGRQAGKREKVLLRVFCHAYGRSSCCS